MSHIPLPYVCDILSSGQLNARCWLPVAAHPCAWARYHSAATHEYINTTTCSGLFLMSLSSVRGVRLYSPFILSYTITLVHLVRLRTEVAYHVPQARPNRGSNSWPPDHDSIFQVTKTPTLTTRPSVTSIIPVLEKHLLVRMLKKLWLKYHKCPVLLSSPSISGSIHFV